MNVRNKMSSVFMESSSSSAPTCSTTTSDSTFSRTESQFSINKQVLQVISNNIFCLMIYIILLFHITY